MTKLRGLTKVAQGLLCQKQTMVLTISDPGEMVKISYPGEMVENISTMYDVHVLFLGERVKGFYDIDISIGRDVTFQVFALLSFCQILQHFNFKTHKGGRETR